MKIRKLVINMHFRCFENFDLGKLSFLCGRKGLHKGYVGVIK